MEQLDDFLKQVPPSSSDDPVVSEKKAYDEIEKRKREAEARHLEIQNESDTQDRDQRKDFAERVYYFACVYMIFVFLILFLSGSTGVPVHGRPRMRTCVLSKIRSFATADKSEKSNTSLQFAVIPLHSLRSQKRLAEQGRVW